MPKSRQRCSTSLSSSSKDPSSRSRPTRSRAVSLPSTCCLWTRSGPPPASARRSFSRRTSTGSGIAAGGGSPAGFTRWAVLWPVAGGFSMATAASAPAAAAAAAGGGHEAPGAGEREARHLLLHLGPRAAGAGDHLAPGADVLLEALVAGAADVLVDGHPGQRPVRAPISFFAFSQSSRNFLSPMSVSGCFTSDVKTA